MNEIDRLAQTIREVDGNHSLGAGALAEALIERGYGRLSLWRKLESLLHEWADAALDSGRRDRPGPRKVARLARATAYRRILRAMKALEQGLEARP